MLSKKRRYKELTLKTEYQILKAQWNHKPIRNSHRESFLKDFTAM
jgi:hypothetical protein